MSDYPPPDIARAEAVRDLFLVWLPVVCLGLVAFVWLAPKALAWWDQWQPVRQAERRPPRSHCRRIPRQPKPFDQLSEEQT